jgi:NAD(P)H-dependent FMN reductase
MEEPKIGIVMSTTRDGRCGEVLARWILDLTSWRNDLDFELVDLRDYPLPMLGETDSSESEAAESIEAWR